MARAVNDGTQRPAPDAMEVEGGAFLHRALGDVRARTLGDSESGGGNNESTTTIARLQSGDTFDDSLRVLVRCLCGVVVGRWKEASSIGKSPKKAWVSYVMEAVHALTLAIEVRNSGTGET